MKPDLKRERRYRFIARFSFSVFVLQLLFARNAAAQTPYFLWATKAGGTNVDSARAIAKDSINNAYVTGSYASPTVTFGTTTLTNSGAAGTDEIFVAKLDRNGNPLWSKSAGGTSYDNGKGIAVDNAGNVFITGSYNGTANFSGTILTGGGMFIAKYDTYGNLIWARHDDGGSGAAVAVDASGNFYVTGNFFLSNPTFGNGSSNVIVLTNTGSSDSFVVKYDNNGNAVWGQLFGSATSRALAVDANTNCYLTGSFISSATFSNVTVTNFNNSGFPDVFVVKYDSSGNFAWAKSAGGAGADAGVSICADVVSCWVTGNYESTNIVFGTTTLTNNSTGGTDDIFVTRYANDGSVVWARSAGGAGYDTVSGITTDGIEHTYITGNGVQPLTFGSTTLTNSGLFVVEYDVGGFVVWAKAAPSANGNAIVSDLFGIVYVAGHFFSGATLDNIILSASGSSFSDLLVTRVGFPPISTTRNSGQLVFNWTTNVTGFVLESATNFPAGTNWTVVTNAPPVVGNQYSVTNPISGAKKFYRLRK